MIVLNCATIGCHDAEIIREGIQLTSYSTLLNYVKLFNAATSKFYTVCVKSGEERMLPPPMAAFT